MKKLLKRFRYGQKGFTLIELLVVVAILGIIAAVAVPNVGSFINRGKAESYSAELHNVQTAVMAMLIDSTSGQLDGAVTVTPNDSMDTVVANSGALKLSAYMTGLGPGNKVKTGCTYAFITNGTVTQTTPP